MQYFINENILLGFFIANYFPEETDSKGIAPPPMIWSVLMKDSTVLMPRNSSSKDMVALQPRDLYVFKSFEPESWGIPKEPEGTFDTSTDDLKKGFKRRGEIVQKRVCGIST